MKARITLFKRNGTWYYRVTTSLGGRSVESGAGYADRDAARSMAEAHAREFIDEEESVETYEYEVGRS